MSAQPLISISCNTYNHAGFIADAIEGFLLQKTDFPFEILIHDDASTDGTADVIRRYQARYPDLIKPVIQLENQYSRNVRIGRFNLERARGKYIALCEGDDYWTDPLKLQKQVAFLEANENYAMCFTDFNRVNEHGEILQRGAVKEAMKTDLRQREVIAGHTLKYMTIIFRRSALDLPLFSSVYVKNGDIFLSALVTRHGPAKYLDFISGCYRVHPGGVWSGRGAIEQRMMMLESLLAIRKALNRDEELKAIEKTIRHVFRRVGKLSVKRNSWIGVKKVFAHVSLLPYMGDFLAGARLQYIERRRQIRRVTINRKARDARIRRNNFRKKIRDIRKKIRDIVKEWVPDFILDKVRKSWRDI
jgi:glycosyltransferase involved in cell wall biosynthesis